MSSAGNLQGMSGVTCALGGQESTLEREVPAAESLAGGAPECTFPDPLNNCEHMQSV